MSTGLGQASVALSMSRPLRPPEACTYNAPRAIRSSHSGVWSAIWSLGSDAPDAADSVEQAIYDACAFLAAGPLRGHRRPDLTTRPVRFWTLSRYPNYTVVYRPETVPLQIVAVLHGKRNIQRILKERP